MKQIKIGALTLGACLALGSFAACDKETEVTSGGSLETAVSETLEHISVTRSPDDQPVIDENDPYISLSDVPEVEPGIAQDPYDVVAVESNIPLDADMQEYANTFVSNFAETYFYDFDKTTASTEQLLDFAHMHIKINSSGDLSNVKKGELSYEVFTFEKANAVIGKYFGFSLNETDCKNLYSPPDSFGDQIAGPYYEDGKIWYISGAGENYNIVAIVESIDGNSDGTITLKFTIYSVSPDSNSGIINLKPYYKLTPEEARTDKTLTRMSAGKATAGIGQSGAFYLYTYENLR